MALKSYRPLTPVQRFKQTPAFDEITKWKPAKSLVEPKKKSGGRNNYGRLTSRHIGGGHKQNYRKVDFNRRKHSQHRAGAGTRRKGCAERRTAGDVKQPRRRLRAGKNAVRRNSPDSRE